MVWRENEDAGPAMQPCCARNITRTRAIYYQGLTRAKTPSKNKGVGGSVFLDDPEVMDQTLDSSLFGPLVLANRRCRAVLPTLGRWED